MDTLGDSEKNMSNTSKTKQNDNTVDDKDEEESQTENEDEDNPSTSDTPQPSASETPQPSAASETPQPSASDTPKPSVSETPQPSASSSGGETPLEYGDIIQLFAPQNTTIHEKIYYINYIDEQIIHLLDVNSDTPDGDGREYTLELDEFHNITDDSIETIALLDRMPERGFIRQNGLRKSQWLNIHFGGDIPSIVVCQITDIEEDMVELKVYPTNDIIYIDFKYQGIPKDLSITNIEIRDEPDDNRNRDANELGVIDEEKDDEEEIDQDPSQDPSQDSDDNETDAELEGEMETPDEGFEIEFGEVLEPIKQIVEVSEERRKYNVNIQKDDLLNDILASIPVYERTYRTMKEVNTIINRYDELRSQFSKRNEKGNITGISKQSKRDHPIYNLLRLDRSEDPLPSWIIPVINNHRKYYVVMDTEDESSEKNSVNYYNPSRNIFEAFPINHMPDVNILKKRNDNQHHQQKNLAYDDFFDPNTQAVTKEHVMREYILRYSNQITLTSHDDPALTSFETEAIRNNATTIEEYPYFMSRILDKEYLPVQGYVVLPMMYILRNTSFGNMSSILSTSNMIGNNSLFYLRNTLKNIEIVKNIMDDVDDNERNDEMDQISRSEKTRTFMSDKINYHAMSSNLVNNQDNIRGNIRAFLRKILPDKSSMMRKVIRQLHKLDNSEETRNIESNKVYRLNQVCKNIHDVFQILYNTLSVSHTNVMKPDIKGVLREVNAYQENIVQMIEYVKGQSNQTRDLETEMESSLTATMNRIHSMLQQKKDHQYMKELYEFEKDIRTKKIVTSETESFVNALKYDQARSITSYITYEDLPLHTDRNVRNILETKLNILKDNKKKLESTGELSNLLGVDGKSVSGKGKPKSSAEECKKLRISKLYRSLEDMAKDEDKEVFYDQDYDETRYDIMDEYKDEQDMKNEEEFKTFLMNHLRQDVGLKAVDAEFEAKALILGRREVEEGDYAILRMTIRGMGPSDETPSSTQSEQGTNTGTEDTYYKRINKKWVLDESVDSLHEGELFCNSKKDCISLRETCSTIDDSKDDLERKTIESIMNEFIQKNEEEKHETKIFVQKKYGENKTNLYLRKQHYALSDQKYNLYMAKIRGLAIGDEEGLQKKSPYMKLRNFITGDTHTSRKMTLMKRFIEKVTRRHIEGKESKHWLYCIDTGVQLLPSFFIDIVDGYFNPNVSMMEVYSILTQSRGRLSENGDKIIDKYSEYTICDIDFVDENRGSDTSGLDMMASISASASMSSSGNNNDVDDIVLSNMIDNRGRQSDDGVKPKHKNLDMEKIEKVIQFMADVIGYTVSKSSRKMLLKNISVLIQKKMGSQDGYMKRLEKKLKARYTKKEGGDSGKIISPGELKLEYEKDKNKYMLYASAFYLLVLIQTSLTDVNIKKYYPNCKRSFEGFPLEPNKGEGGIKYMACILKRTSAVTEKHSSNVWYSLKEVGMTGIINQLKKMNDFISSEGTNLVKRKLKNMKRREKMAGKPDSNDSESSSDMTNAESLPIMNYKKEWTNFSPKLYITRETEKVKPIKALGKSFMASLKKDFETGHRDQTSRIHLIYTTIMMYTYHLQKFMFQITNKEDILLHTNNDVYFLQNVCCSQMVDAYERGKSLDYFTEKDSNMVTLLNSMRDLHIILNKIGKNTKVPFIRLKKDPSLSLSNESTPAINSDSLATYMSKDSIYRIFFYICERFENDIQDQDMIRIYKQAKQYVETVNNGSKNSGSMTEKKRLQLMIERMEQKGKTVNDDVILLYIQMIHRSSNQSDTIKLQNTNINDNAVGIDQKMAMSENSSATSSSDSNINPIPTISNPILLKAVSQLNSLENGTILSPQFKTNVVGFIMKTNQTETMEKALNWLLRMNDPMIRQMKELFSLYMTGESTRERKTINALLDTRFGLQIDQSFDSTVQLKVKAQTVTREIQLLKQMIHQSVYVIPEVINRTRKQIESKLVKDNFIPTHWGLSASHKKLLNLAFMEHHESIKRFESNKILMDMFTNTDIKEEGKIIRNLVDGLPHAYIDASARISGKNDDYSEPGKKDVEDNDDETSKMKNRRLVNEVNTLRCLKELHVFILLKWFTTLVDKISYKDEQEAYDMMNDANEDFISDAIATQTQTDTINGDDIEMNNVRNELDNNERIMEMVTSYIFMNLQQINRMKNSILYTDEVIVSRMLRIRDDEKNRKTRMLKNMDPEDRTMDNILKHAKLGRHGIGLEKGLRQYDPDFYDREFEDLMKENALDSLNGVNSMLSMENMRLYGNSTVMNQVNRVINDEIVEAENAEQEENALQVEEEEYNMSNQGDDDDYDSENDEYN